MGEPVTYGPVRVLVLRGHIENIIQHIRKTVHKMMGALNC